MSIIFSLLVFVTVVFVHELGHFAVAKMVGVKVNEFSIGMGPSIYNKVVGETQYSLRALPIGGYVAMEGEDDSSDDPRGFNNVAKYKKLMILVAGALMNFILAIVVSTIAFMNLTGPTPVVEDTVVDSPASEAGILPGDQIIQIGDRAISSWEDINPAINEQESPLEIVVIRDNEEHTVNVIPTTEEDRQIIGISPKFEKVKVDNPLKEGINYTKTVSTEILRYVKKLVTGKADTSELSGPIGIVSIIGQSAKLGLVPILLLTAMISANLGVLNLLPFPALDGGTILITIIEMILNRDLPEKVTIGLNFVGFVLLMSFMLYVTIFNDIL